MAVGRTHITAQTRRDFLRSVLATGAAANVAVAATGTTTGRADGMPRRILGRTKEAVTILGLGCAYAGGEVSEAQTRATIEAALEGGVRYFDAAPEYTAAEERLAPVIKPVRDECFLVTKTYAHDAKQAEKDLDRALRQLRTDHVDLFLQHGVGLKPISTNREVLGKGGSLEFLRRAKKQGRTRFIGMSVHWPHASAVELIEKSDAWDVVMPYINYVSRAQQEAAAEVDPIDGDVLERKELLPSARRAKLGVVAMKVLGGNPGPLAKDFDRAFRYALSVPGVACALIGVKNAEQVRRAVQAARAFRPMTEAEMGQTIRLGEEMVRARSSASTILERHRAADLGSMRYA